MSTLTEISEPRWIGMRPVRTHSIVLAVAGVVYILVGYTYLTGEPSADRLEALQYALNWLEYKQWGWVWVITGVLALVSSRWPPVSETWGYTALTGQAAAWALFYGAGVVFGGSNVQYLSGVLSWGLLAFMWWAISRLVNPEVLQHLLNRIVELQNENLALHDEVHRLRENRGD